MDSQKSPYFLPALVLGLALVLSSLVGAGAFTKSKRLGNTLAVTGSAEKIVDSDTVKWSIGLSHTVSPDQKAVAGKRLNEDRGELMALLKTIGIMEADVSIQPLNIWPTTEYNNATGVSVLTGYTASQTIVVETDKVDAVGTLAQTATATLAEKGVDASSQSLEYYYGKIADVKLELLTAATKNAHERADAIVSGGGGSVGPAQSADTGVFQITAVNSSDLSDYGSYDTSSPKKKITAVVHVSFGLE
ncbi:SIMPL domain-containing protein [Candidatus Uhrbacteria bacterium]|nr:SIMPL domain-containing protein [Candidatus Uhrbacteria bacterium]